MGVLDSDKALKALTALAQMVSPIGQAMEKTQASRQTESLPARIGTAPPAVVPPPMQGGSAASNIPTMPGMPYTGATPQGNPYAPQAMPSPVAKYGTEFRTKQGAKAAGIAMAAEGLSQAAVQFEQMMARQRYNKARAMTADWINAQTSTDPNYKKSFQERMQDPKYAKEYNKVMGKARKDPNSPEYFGYQAAVAGAQQQAAVEMTRQETLARMQEAQAKTAKARMETDVFARLSPEEQMHWFKVQQNLEPSADAIVTKNAMIEAAKLRNQALVKGPVVQMPDKTWAQVWNNKDGTLAHYEPLQGTPAGQVPKETTTHSTEHLNDDGTVSRSSIRVTAPKATTPTTDNIKKGDTKDLQHSYRRQAVIDYWAYQAAAGNKPPAGILARAASMRMAELGLQVRGKIPDSVKSRAAFADTLLMPQAASGGKGMIDYTIALIQANRDKLGMIPGTTAEIERALGTIDPNASKIYSNLKSIYSVAGGIHGWRSLRVAQEFEQAYGGLRRNPDALIADLQEMKLVAGAVSALGKQPDVFPVDLTKPGGMAPPGAQAPAPATGANPNDPLNLLPAPKTR